jgi:hypothetical protein
MHAHTNFKKFTQQSHTKIASTKLPELRGQTNNYPQCMFIIYYDCSDLTSTPFFCTFSLLFDAPRPSSHNLLYAQRIKDFGVTDKHACTFFDFRKSMHHHTIQINQPTRCKNFTGLLLDVYVWLNMFRAPLRPSSGAYNCTRSLWFYRLGGVVGALLVVGWPDLDQQRSREAPETC